MFNSERSFSLTREEACDKLLRLYKSYYNIHRFDGGESAVREGSTVKGKTDEEVSGIVAEDGYPLVARCDFFEHSQKYVISRKAELWSADREEFLYLFSVHELTMDLFEKCRDYVYDDGMERLSAGPGHMYTYLTAVFLCDTCDAKVVRALKKTRIYKSFHFSLHGWMDHHTALVELSTGQIDANPGGRHTAKFLKKVLYSSRMKGDK